MRILITGGSSGMGAATAKSLADDNQIFITGRSSQKLEQVANEVIRNGGACIWETGEVQDSKKVEEIISKMMKKYKGIDVVVLSAGVGYFKQIEELSDREYLDMMETNVQGFLTIFVE